MNKRAFAALLAVLPVAALAEPVQPPLPSAAPRPEVSVEGQPRHYAEPVPRRRDDSPVADEPAAKEPTPEPISETKPDAPRGIQRANLLRKLEGGDIVMLEADPANPPTMTESMELVEAVAFALKSNFELAASKAKTESSQWELVGGFGQYLPRIDYNRKKGHEKSRPASFHNAAGETIPSDHHRTWSREISARQPVVDLAIVTDILGRWGTLDTSTAEERGVREKVALDTISSFLRLLQSRLLIQFASRYKDNLDQLSQRMQDRVSGGGASPVELERVNARSVSARSAMIEAQAEYQAAIIEFRRLTGQTPQKLALPISLLPEIPGNVDDVMGRALRTNPDYRAALARVDTARANAAKPWANLAPKLSVEFSDNRTWNSGGVTAELPANATPAGIYPYTNERKVMGVVSMQLNGGTDFAQGLANAALTRQAVAQAADAKARLEESIRTGYSALSAANGRVEALSQAVDANGKVATVFEEQYLAGSRQLLDLLDSYERLYQSQTELSRLVVAEATATFLVRRQMGELVTALMLGKEED